MNYWYVPLDGGKPYWSEEPPNGNDMNDANLRVFRLIDLELFEMTSKRKMELIDASRLVKDPDGNKFTKHENVAKDLVDNSGWTYV